MATNNIYPGNNIVIAAFDSDMSVFTTEDTIVVRSVVNGNYVSYQPGRTINSLNGIVGGQGYLVTSKVERYINGLFAGPLLQGLFTPDSIVKLIAPISQDDYDAIPIKQPQTLYLVTIPPQTT